MTNAAFFLDYLNIQRHIQNGCRFEGSDVNVVVDHLSGFLIFHREQRI